MKNRNYKLTSVQHMCTICPNDYWKQLKENNENRYHKDNDLRR